jgi:hypothetical protein
MRGLLAMHDYQRLRWVKDAHGGGVILTGSGRLVGPFAEALVFLLMMTCIWHWVGQI